MILHIDTDVKAMDKEQLLEVIAATHERERALAWRLSKAVTDGVLPLDAPNTEPKYGGEGFVPPVANQPWNLSQALHGTFAALQNENAALKRDVAALHEAKAKAEKDAFRLKLKVAELEGSA